MQPVYIVQGPGTSGGWIHNVFHRVRGRKDVLHDLTRFVPGEPVLTITKCLKLLKQECVLSAFKLFPQQVCMGWREKLSLLPTLLAFSLASFVVSSRATGCLMQYGGRWQHPGVQVRPAGRIHLTKFREGTAWHILYFIKRKWPGESLATGSGRCPRWTPVLYPWQRWISNEMRRGRQRKFCQAGLY